MRQLLSTNANHHFSYKFDTKITLYKFKGHIKVENLALGNILTFLDLEVTFITNLDTESQVFFKKSVSAIKMIAFLIFLEVIMSK